MSTPTIEQRIEIYREVLSIYDHPYLLTADELRAVLAELAALREALRNCAFAASGGNTEQIAWIVEGALAARKEAAP